MLLMVLGSAANWMASMVTGFFVNRWIRFMMVLLFDGGELLPRRRADSLELRPLHKLVERKNPTGEELLRVGRVFDFRARSRRGGRVLTIPILALRRCLITIGP